MRPLEKGTSCKGARPPRSWGTGVSCELKMKGLLVLRRRPRAEKEYCKSMNALFRSAAVPHRTPSSRYHDDQTAGWRALQSVMAP